MTKPVDKTSNLFNASGCLTPHALEKTATGSLSPAEAGPALAHIKVCELCSDAVDGLKMWHKHNEISVYADNENEKRTASVDISAAFDKKVIQLNDRLRNRVKFHLETDNVKQKRRIGTVPAWLAVAASIVLFAGIYLVLEQNKLSEKSIADNRSEAPEFVAPPVTADTIIHETPSAIAENKPATRNTKIPVPVVVDGIASFSDKSIHADNEENEFIAVAETSAAHPVERPVGGVTNTTEQSQVAEDPVVTTIQADMEKSQPAPAAATGKKSVNTARETRAEVAVEDENTVFTVVEKQPEFPGGPEKLNRYLSEKLQYPAEARENSISGTVFIQFVIDKTGTVANAKILRGIGYGCDEEALRVIKAMPRWKPAEQRGKPVNVLFNLPVKFNLE